MLLAPAQGHGQILGPTVQPRSRILAVGRGHSVAIGQHRSCRQARARAPVPVRTRSPGSLGGSNEPKEVTSCACSCQSEDLNARGIPMNP